MLIKIQNTFFILLFFISLIGIILYNNISINTNYLKIQEKKNIIYLTPITNKSSEFFLGEIYKPSVNRVFICDNITINRLCNIKLKNSYNFNTLPEMMHEMFTSAYNLPVKYDFFIKFDDDTIIRDLDLIKIEKLISNAIIINKNVIIRKKINCEDTNIGIHGFFYGFSRNLLECAFINRPKEISYKNITYNEDCHTGYRLDNFCNENPIIIEFEKIKFYHRYFEEGRVSLNMSFNKNN